MWLLRTFSCVGKVSTTFRSENRILRLAQKGVAICANSSPVLDCLLVYICSMDLDVHPCQFSKVYKDLQIDFNKSVDYREVFTGTTSETRLGVGSRLTGTVN